MSSPDSHEHVFLAPWPYGWTVFLRLLASLAVLLTWLLFAFLLPLGFSMGGANLSEAYPQFNLIFVGGAALGVAALVCIWRFHALVSCGVLLTALLLIVGQVGG